MLKERLHSQLRDAEVADRIFAWLRPRLSPTLKLDQQATDEAIRIAVEKTPDATITYAAGDVLAKAGVPLDPDHIVLLGMEYQKWLEERWNTAPLSFFVRGVAVTL